MVTRVPSLFLSLPLPFSLTHSPPPSLSFPLFCNIPSLNVQPVCPSRLSEYATSRLDTLHGRRDRNGPRGDPDLKTSTKNKINTPRQRRAPESGRRGRGDSRLWRVFFFFFFFFFSIRRGPLLAKWREGRREGTEHLEWQKNSTQGLALKLRLRPPSVQTTCSLSYWCTVVCTLVRLGMDPRLSVCLSVSLSLSLCWHPRCLSEFFFFFFFFVSV